MKIYVAVMVAILLTMSACDQKPVRMNLPEPVHNLTREEVRARRVRGEMLDSLAHNAIVVSAIDTLKKYYGDPFEKTYGVAAPDDDFNAKVTVRYGKLFSGELYYGMIHMESQNRVLTHLYTVKNNTIREVLAVNKNPMMHKRDTIRDVNGDGRKDFLVHWYGHSGCCRRNSYDVYLGLPNGGFSSRYDFKNPTFYPSEKIIRGVEYGYDSPLYKYRWNGFEIDTVEYVHRDSADAKYYTTKKYYDHKKLKEFDKLPAEYLTVEDLDWFESVRFE